MSDDVFVDVNPIRVEQNLISFSATAFDGRIVDALAKLSGAIAQNGRALSELVDKVGRLETQISAQAAGFQTQIQDVRGEVRSLSESARALQTQHALTKDVILAHQAAIDSTVIDVSDLKERLTGVESGSCPSLVNAMSLEAENKANAVAALCNSRAEQMIETEVRQVKGYLATTFKDQRAESDLLLDKLRQHLVETVRGVSEKQTEELVRLRSEFARPLGLFHRLLQETHDHDISFWKRALSDIYERLRKGSEEVKVLFSSLMLDRGVCFALCGINANNSQESSTRVAHSESSSTGFVPTSSETTLESIESSLVTLSKETRLQWKDIKEDFERRSTLLESFESISEGESDQKVAYLMQLPHALRLRYVIQHETQDRLAALKSELQHDMVTELLDVQRELKSKVALAKMSEIMELHRDENLYNTIRSVVSDLQDLRQNKLDVHQFVDALKAKADIRALDTKVDVSDLSVHIDSINNNAEKLGRDITRSFERCREIEGGLRNLQEFVLTGGGVYSEISVLNEKLASATLLELDGESTIHPLNSSSLRTRHSRKSSVLTPSKSHEEERERAAPRGGALTSSSEVLGSRPVASKAAQMLQTLTKSDTKTDDPPEGESIVLTSPVRANRSSSEDASMRELSGQVLQCGPSPPRYVNRPSTFARDRNNLKTPKRPSSSDLSSPKARVNHHLSGGALDLSGASRTAVVRTPTNVPMTASQREYCDNLGVDPAATLRVLQAGTPNITAKEARSMRPAEV